MVQEIMEKSQIIMECLPIAHSRQMNNTDMKRQSLHFQVGDCVYLRVSPLKRMMGCGNRKRLSSRYIGPFEISECVNDMTCKVSLPSSIPKVHNVFHVSMLRKHVPNSELVVNYKCIDLKPNMSYEEYPAEILDSKEQVLRTRTIPSVKVRWEKHSPAEATWEHKEEIHKRYPYLFFLAW